MAVKYAHTPGPWIAKKGAGWYITRPDAHARREAAFVVGVHPSVSLVDAPSDDDAEAEANAHLIAAAPAMLAALETMVRIYGDPEYCDGETPPEIIEARAAIAQAKGE